MDKFTPEHLKELAEALGEPAVSVYMPTFRSGREVRQNVILTRLKPAHWTGAGPSRPVYNQTKLVTEPG